MKARRKLYLIGAGELAREIESWISLDKEFLKKWEIIGFLDHNLNAINDYPSDYSVIGFPDTFTFQAEDAAIMCIANPVSKKKLVETIGNKVEFITYISNFAIIAKHTNIGKGSVICPNSIISTNCHIECFTTINCSCNIGHDCTIGKYSSLMPHTDLGGHVKIGSNIFMGTKATVIPNKSIKDNITVGAGSLITRNLSKEGTYFGNPATLLKF